MKTKKPEAVDAPQTQPSGAELDELYTAHQVHTLAQRLLHCLMTDRGAPAPLFRPFTHWYP